MISAELSKDGDKSARSYMLKGEWNKAQKRIKKISSKAPADWYHLGLTLEATAASNEDYHEAKRMYLKAFGKKELRMFAEGIGRMERRLSESKLLQKQVIN